MVQSKGTARQASGPTVENIRYVREMLVELRSVAESEGCDMLCYLLEMAYLEASEIHVERRTKSADGSQS